MQCSNLPSATQRRHFAGVCAVQLHASHVWQDMLCKVAQLDGHCSNCTRYYGQQRAMDTVSANMDKDEFKRKAREARERQGEQQLLEAVYQV